MGKKEKKPAQKHKIKIQDEAYNDIEQIAEFIASQNQQPLTAIKIVDSVFQTIDKLETILLLIKSAKPFQQNQKFIVRQFAHLG